MFKSILALISISLALPLYAGALPEYSEVQTALREVVKEKNGGFGFHMWATIVDREGVVQTVTFSGKERGDQLPSCRVLSAAKANTSNAYSLPQMALSSSNLYTQAQPGQLLYGMLQGNPVDTSVAYGGKTKNIGRVNDPMVGKKIGGINVFGGGLPLYNKEGKLLGAIGVAGDVVCADHNIAWKLRHKLGLDYVPQGSNDNINYDIENGVSKSGFGHPSCGPEAEAIAKALPESHPYRTKK